MFGFNDEYEADQGKFWKNVLENRKKSVVKYSIEKRILIKF